MALEQGEVTALDGRTEGLEDGYEGASLGPREELLGGEAPEEDVTGDEVGEDVGAVRDVARQGLQVGSLETDGSPQVVVADGEAEAAEVVEKRDSLCCWVEGEGWRVCCQVEEDHLGKMSPAALQTCKHLALLPDLLDAEGGLMTSSRSRRTYSKEKLEDQVGKHVDAFLLSPNDIAICRPVRQAIGEDLLYDLSRGLGDRLAVLVADLALEAAREVRPPMEQHGEVGERL